MVRPLQDVKEPRHDEPQRGLAPSRIEPHKAGVSSELESANRASRGEESRHGNHAQSQPGETGLN